MDVTVSVVYVDEGTLISVPTIYQARSGTFAGTPIIAVPQTRRIHGTHAVAFCPSPSDIVRMS